MTAGVFVPLSAEGFEFCHPLKPQDFETLNRTLDGTPRLGTWRSIPMRIIREDEGKGLSESDSPWLGSHALIFRRPALRELESMLLTYGELLPVECADHDLVFFNPTRVLDALDEKSSEVVRFANGRIMRITRYAFRSEVISGIDAFKIPSLRVSPTYLSDQFVERFRAAGLRGLAFKRVWSQ